jgi:putative Holliday junction resolvase
MSEWRGRILAVDHGEKRIGLAISDEGATIARPLGVLVHVSRALDAARVAETARERGAALIVVGQSLDDEGDPNPAGRRAGRFAEALGAQTTLPIVFWDESLTTRDARDARLAMGVSRKKRSGHLDDFAAAVLLQSYLDAVPRPGSPPLAGEGDEAGRG